MPNRSSLAAFAIVVIALGAPACSPQVVDAVQTTAGSGGGSGGTGITGGTGIGGSEDECPDGGPTTDRDGDGELDCNDQCPDDALKIVPGTCGCGLPNPNEVDGGTSCLNLQMLLAHRYTFDGPVGSTELVDAVAGKNGDVVRATLSGEGTLVLAGRRYDQFGGLPNYLLRENPDNPSMTFEAWVRWDGGRAWQRIFDFGDAEGAMEGDQGARGSSYLFLTPRTPVEASDPAVLWTGKLRLAYKRPGPLEPELIVEAPIALPSGGDAPTQVVAVVDAVNKQMSLFVNGVRQNGVAFVAGAPTIVNMAGPYDWGTPLDDGTLPPPVDLPAINDINNWLGRSQFSADDGFGGTYYDFRIYSGALTDELVLMSYKAGPDAVFLPTAN